MSKFLKKLQQLPVRIHPIQFPHYHRKFTAPSIPLPINLILLLLLILLILINLFHSMFFGFNEEKRLKRKILNFPFVSDFHEELGAYYLGTNLAEAGHEYYLANGLYEESFLSEETDAQVLGITIPPRETWYRLIGTHQNMEKELNYWQEIGTVFPNYAYSHLKKAFLYDGLGNTQGVKIEVQSLKWEFNDLPELKTLKNKYGFL